MPDAAELTPAKIAAIQAEVERREQMPFINITCHLPERGEEKEISVQAWEERSTPVKNGTRLYRLLLLVSLTLCDIT